MDKFKANFSTLNECDTKKMYGVYDISLSVVGSETKLEDGHFNDVLCVPSIFYNLLQIY
jgi:hypothetical protein